MSRALFVLCLPLALLATACGGASESRETAASAKAAISPPGGSVVGRWTGRWIGPEGTDLVLTPHGNGYTVTIRNLDGPRTFDGAIEGDEVRFVRDGKTESIHAGSGTDTGMKWLAGKKDCLVVAASEGYCRD